MGAGVSRPAPTPNEQNLCDCCFYPFDGSKVWHNGGFAHARCAAEHERLILGDDAMPGLLEHLDYLDDLQAFLGRLGSEAAALGIDRQQIVRAIERVRG
jgi:hypothetical protein